MVKKQGRYGEEVPTIGKMVSIPSSILCASLKLAKWHQMVNLFEAHFVPLKGNTFSQPTEENKLLRPVTAG